jgi:hypothetical protein
MKMQKQYLTMRFNKFFIGKITLAIITLLVFTTNIFGQATRIKAKENFEGTIGNQKVSFYMETIETYEKSQKSYLVTQYKGWYKIGNGQKVNVVNDWEGSGAIEFTLNTKSETIVLSLENYTENNKPKTLKGWILHNGIQQEITLIKKIKK